MPIENVLVWINVKLIGKSGKIALFHVTVESEFGMDSKWVSKLARRKTVT